MRILKPRRRVVAMIRRSARPPRAIIRAVFVAAVLSAICNVQAAPLPDVPPEVVSVVTTGHWQSGQATGQYKIIVTTEGWEHLWSRAFVEWLPDPADPNAARKAVAISELIPPIGRGTAVFEVTANQVKAGGLVVTIRATANQLPGAKPQVFVFIANTPGHVELVKPVRRK